MTFVLVDAAGRRRSPATLPGVYLQGIDNHEIIDTVYARRAPMLPASAGLHR